MMGTHPNGTLQHTTVQTLTNRCNRCKGKVETVLEQVGWLEVNVAVPWKRFESVLGLRKETRARIVTEETDWDQIALEQRDGNAAAAQKAKAAIEAAKEDGVLRCTSTTPQTTVGTLEVELAMLEGEIERATAGRPQNSAITWTIKLTRSIADALANDLLCETTAECNAEGTSNRAARGSVYALHPHSTQRPFNMATDDSECAEDSKECTRLAGCRGSSDCNKCSGVAKVHRCCVHPHGTRRTAVTHAHPALFPRPWCTRCVLPPE